VQYKGFWDEKMTKIEGLGEIKFSDGSVYAGMANKDSFYGLGRITHKNGDTYQGNFKDGKAHGFGVAEYKKNDEESEPSTGEKETVSTYEGNWVDDKQHGQGIETWAQRSMQYEGDFNMGAKTGHGKF